MSFLRGKNILPIFCGGIYRWPCHVATRALVGNHGWNMLEPLTARSRKILKVERSAIIDTTIGIQYEKTNTNIFYIIYVINMYIVW